MARAASVTLALAALLAVAGSARVGEEGAPADGAVGARERDEAIGQAVRWLAYVTSIHALILLLDRADLRVLKGHEAPSTGPAPVTPR